ncbi:MAG: hypothetical protein JWR64_1243, partial [Marmoricola sp.]|nr:hypothetical protein [Marmoricola sp.]
NLQPPYPNSSEARRTFPGARAGP